MDAPTELPRPKFRDLIKPTTTPVEFKSVVGQLLTPENKTILGGADKAVNTVARSFMFMAAFAPSPATFGEDMFRGVAATNLPDNQVTELLKVAKSFGVLEETPQGRFEIDAKLQDTLRSILSQIK